MPASATGEIESTLALDGGGPGGRGGTQPEGLETGDTTCGRTDSSSVTVLDLPVESKLFVVLIKGGTREVKTSELAAFLPTGY